MRPASRLKPGMTVRKILKERLSETKGSPAELAEAAGVPPRYVHELISGRRRPPWPGRTDVYEKMTRFLKLSHNDLAMCAKAEREADAEESLPPQPQVREELLALCDAEVAGVLRGRARHDQTEMTDIISRLLTVVRSNALRTLDAQIPLRLAASRNGSSYEEMRMQVLEFLDVSPGTLTIEHLAEFVRPHVANWTVDLGSGVLRVTLRPAAETEKHRRRPITQGFPRS